MKDKDLDILFKEAYERASNIKEPLPPDIMLRIYAYYKQATHGTHKGKPHANSDLIDAFKINAWIQVSHLSSKKAKKLYIETINALL